MVYNPSTFSLTFITNSTELSNGSVNLANWADMVLYSPDSTKVFAPSAQCADHQRPGGRSASD